MALKRKKFSKLDGLKYGWLKDAKKFLLLFAVVFFLLQLVMGISFVKGDSMEPTLQDGELVVYLRLGQKYKRGDVVPVRIPTGEYYVKRVIAVPGDTVEIKAEGIYVNGALLEEPYAQGSAQSKGGNVRYPLTLEEGQVFVVGDNRDVSVDSRSFGVVGTRQIRGRILFHAGWVYVKGM